MHSFGKRTQRDFKIQLFVDFFRESYFFILSIMKLLPLNVSLRKETGKGAARRARAAKQIPGVIYGISGSSTLNVKEVDFRALMRAKGDATVLVEINDETGKKHLSVLQAIQRDPITDRFLHVDFHEVSEKEAMHATLPIHIKGEAFGVKNEKGLLECVTHKIDVACLPKDLPEFIELDVSNLHVGEAIHVKDLPKLNGVKYMQNEAVVVVSCIGADMKEVEEPVPAVEAEAKAEGEAAAPADAEKTEKKEKADKKA